MSKPTFDKFGHYRGLKVKTGPPGRGFALDEHGNYDMQGKSLTNLQDPENDQDSVTKSHLKRKMDTCLQFDANKKGFNCRRGRLFDVMRPEADNDAVTLSLLKEKTINNMEDGVFDGKKMRLKNVADPLAQGDAVNLNFLQAKTLNCKESNEFDGENRRIKNIAAPVENQDCVNLSFLKEKTLNSLDAEINAGGKKIVNLSGGVNKDEAVNFGILLKWIKFSGIIMERELADAVIEIRREMHRLRKPEIKKADIENRLKTIEGTVDRDWRAALHVSPRKGMSEAEFAQLAKMGINKEALQLFSSA